MEATRYGVGLLSHGEDGDGGMLAVDTSDLRRAVAAMRWSPASSAAAPVLGTPERDRLHDQLADGSRVLVRGWARFTQDSDWWNADPVPERTPDAMPVVWLVDD